MSSDVEVTVTIKFSGDYDAPWTVFRGAPDRVFENICETFGISADDAEGLTLGQLVAKATKAAKALYGVSSAGGTAIAPWKARGAKQSGSSVQKKEEPKGDPLLELIESQTSIKGLQNVWGDHSTKIKADDNLNSAFINKGKSLKEGK